MKDNIIQFYPWGEDSMNLLSPSPASKNIAPYWKEMPLFHNEGDLEKYKNKIADRSNVFMSLKHCMPYFDAMIAGYHYLLHTDIYINLNNDGFPEITWDSPKEPVGKRVLKEMPVPHGHYQAHYGWQMWWGSEVPPGWSLLFIHPIARYDLPFTTTSGLVDADNYPLPGNVSFHIKDNFEGVIKAGTPIMSIIPIKRENWKSSINTDKEFFENKSNLVKEKAAVDMAHYKKQYREGMYHI